MASQFGAREKLVVDGATCGLAEHPAARFVVPGWAIATVRRLLGLALCRRAV
jgi:hypothetical protein